jgi:hypothetical protein
MESRKYFEEGWGAGKCPNCGSYNTDSQGEVDGLPPQKDCYDCGHGWDAQRGGHPHARRGN